MAAGWRTEPLGAHLPVVALRQAMRSTRMQQKRKQDTPEIRPNTDAKTRRCLLCGKSFQSEWAGERVCKRCKSTAAWRTG